MPLKIIRTILSSFLFITLFSCGGSDGTLPPAAVNLLPIADAGIDQIQDENTLITLTGSGVDSDGTIVSYLWQQTAGVSVNLENNNTKSTTFTAPETTESLTLMFSLTVTDNKGAINTDAIQITINPVNAIPTINVGEDQNVNEQTSVTLTATANDTDGNIVSYLWQQTSGTTVELINNETSSIDFVSPTLTQTETLTFSITVTDNEAATAVDTVNITVFPVNSAPTVNVGDDKEVFSLAEVSLIGSASDSDGNISSYIWQQTAGPSVNLINTTTAIVTFTAPENTSEEGIQLTFMLTVTDNERSAMSDSITVTVLKRSSLIVFDDNLRACIKQTAIENNWLTSTDFTSLQCGKSPIYDLTGLENFTSLKILFLENIWLTDISPIISISALEQLTLKSIPKDPTPLGTPLIYNQLEDISSISQLVNLTTLELTGNVIKNFTALSTLTKLVSLNLADNRLTNISNISAFTNLHTLNLNSHCYAWSDIEGVIFDTTNNILDYTPIANLKQLTKLHIAHTNPIDLNLLNGFSNLTELTVGGTIGSLRTIENWWLDTRDGTGCGVSQITGLSLLNLLTQLTYLDIRQQTFENVNFLSNLTNLTTLNLTNTDKNGVPADLSALTNLTKLKSLYLRNNFLSSATELTPLLSLINLEELDIASNGFDNINFLSTYNTLTSISVENNKLIDISGISTLNNLKVIDLSINQITDLTPLFNLTQLTSLNLGANYNIPCTDLDNLKAALVNTVFVDNRVNSLSCVN